MPSRRPRLRICLITTQDLDASPFPDDDWPCDPRPFLRDAEWDVATLVDNDTSIAAVESLIASGRFDLFFNLCDGAADQRTPGIEVVETLERHRVPFVGAVSACYEPTRTHLKRVCRRLGIASPRCVVARTEAEIDRAAKTLRFPLFVKHHSSYASIDLSRRSKVCSVAGLRIQARKMISRHGAALVEEYIDGLECTALVAENPADPGRPIAYPPIQYRFPKGEQFKHENLKWVDYAALEAEPVGDPGLARRIREECGRLFVALGAASFGRFDLRVDDAGTPFILEINPNCGVYFPPGDYGGADLCLAHDPGGHHAFTRTLVDAAFARHRRAANANGDSTTPASQSAGRSHRPQRTAATALPCGAGDGTRSGRPRHDRSRSTAAKGRQREP
jgi:D-alanine-D-alanine ligase